MAKKKTPAKPTKKTTTAPAKAPKAKSAPKSTRKPAAPKPVPPPSRANSQPQFASFEEAKSATIDALVQSIEEAEEKLHAAKRAQSFETLPKVF